MKGMKFKAGPIILPLVILGGVLAANIALSYNKTNAASSVSLGQQYLEDMNYSAAIAAFTEAIEINPGNSEARIGLARSYSGQGDYELAEEVIEEIVYTQNPNTEAAKTLVDIYTEQNMPVEALRVVTEIIETSNDEEFYDLKAQLLEELFKAPHSYSVGTAHYAAVQDGKVYTKGDNTLGQLGTSNRGSINSNFKDAGFPKTAAKVYCAQNTTYVVDTDGNLWAAGENKWGQSGIGYASLSEETGWREISCPGKVASVAGTPGRLLVLLTDGTLWTSGAGGDYTLRRVSNFPTVIALETTDNSAVILTADGTEYISKQFTPDTWSKNRTGLNMIYTSGGYIDAMTSQGNILTDRYVQWQSDWTESRYGNVTPTLTVGKIAILNSGLILYTDLDGRLFRITDYGNVSEYETGKNAINLYVCGDAAVIEYDDGSALLWSSDSQAPQNILK